MVPLNNPFSPIKKRKAVEQVAEALRNAILDGSIQPGELLPSERQLAETFGVNRGTVREAITRLEVLGLVQVRHGGGARVCDFLVTAGLQLLPFLVAPSGTPDLPVLRDLLDLRVMFLGWTAEQAAANPAEEDLDALAGIIGEMEAGRADGSRLKELDFDFFERLVAMTGNRVLRLVANVIRKVYMEGPPFFGLLYAEGLDASPHRRALEALKNRDAAGARAAMEAHGRSALERFSILDPRGDSGLRKDGKRATAGHEQPKTASTRTKDTTENRGKHSFRKPSERKS